MSQTQTKTMKSKNSSQKAENIRIKVIPTEIYSRVVGYYRPIQNWNKGKVEEFQERNLIDPQSPFQND